MRGLLLVVPLALLAQRASAQALVVKEEAPGLLAKAKISGDSALKVAQARIPNATMRSAEIEKEHGRLVYSFDLAVAGKTGVEEVLVSAVTGKIVAVEHEDAEDEAKESYGDSGKAKDKRPASSKP